MTAPAIGGLVDVVVKVGGGLLATPQRLLDALDAIADAAVESTLLVLPGGGPFADTVREVDRVIGLTPDTAHWMAVLAMDQYAELLQSRLRGGALVHGPSEVADAHESGSIPVLAPSRWLRDEDPLPHSWEVTSDSIAAWVAGALGAPRLVLLKPAGASGEDAIDPYFTHALPPGTTAVILPANLVHTLRETLRGGTAPERRR